MFLSVVINVISSLRAVSAKSAGTGEVHAGGIVGRMSGHATNDKLNNLAYIGTSVTAMGSGQKNIGRIYGSTAITVNTTRINSNYARDTTRVEVSNSYNTISFPYWDGSGTAPATYYTLPNSTDGTSRHGINAANSSFQSQNIWTSSSLLGFASQTSGTPPTAVWDLSRILWEHPRLAKVGEQ